MTKPLHFDEISNQLWDGELRELQDLWANYNYLYVEDPERAERLRGPHWGGFFWNLVQRCIVSEIILSISRLTDAPEMGKHQNLTLRTLLDDPRLPPQLGCELGSELESIRVLTEDLRKHRNRVIAHKDGRTALGEDALPILRLDQIRDIIPRLQDIHRKHRVVCMERSVSEYGTHTLRSVDNLIKRLEQSEKARLIFAQAKRSDEGKLRDWDRARRVFFPLGA